MQITEWCSPLYAKHHIVIVCLLSDIKYLLVISDKDNMHKRTPEKRTEVNPNPPIKFSPKYNLHILNSSPLN